MRISAFAEWRDVGVVRRAGFLNGYPGVVPEARKTSVPKTRGVIDDCRDPSLGFVRVVGGPHIDTEFH